MATPLDYLRWRGDFSIEQDAFNSVDASLFSLIAYLPFDTSVHDHTIGECVTQLLKSRSYVSRLAPETLTQLRLIELSPRFGQLKILDWSAKIQKEPAIQFTAFTTRLDAHTIIIAFRGTDASIIGWNEDIAMSYVPETCGQMQARDYLDKIASRYPNDQIYLVGHSKGGNFAVYASANAEPAIQDRIKLVLSFDGPGYASKVFTSEGFKKMMPKVKTYVPEGSIFGMMLDHPERTLVIKSERHIWQQHNPLGWNVGRKSFVLAENGLSTASRVVRQTLIGWNGNIPKEKRELMWSALFTAFEEQQITNLNQLTAHKVLGMLYFSRAYLSLDPEMRLIASQIISDLLTNTKANINFHFIKNKETKHSNDSKKGPIVTDHYEDI